MASLDQVARHQSLITCRACFQVDAAAGVLVVGHKQGEARMYQFSQEDQDAVCVDLDGKRPAEHLPRRQPAGFQCILQCSHHAATISSIAVASKARLLALADEAGCVSVVDLSRVSMQSVFCPPMQSAMHPTPAASLLPAKLSCWLWLMKQAVFP